MSDTPSVPPLPSAPYGRPIRCQPVADPSDPLGHICMKPAKGQALATNPDGTLYLSPPLCEVHLMDSPNLMTVVAPRLPVFVAPWIAAGTLKQNAGWSALTEDTDHPNEVN